MNPQVTKITIGRKPGNTIVLDNHDVSGMHASLTLITPVTNTWEIQDLGSANGTFVDGMRIFRKEVNPASQIRLGNTSLSWEQILGKKAKPAAPSPIPAAPQAAGQTVYDEVKEIAANLRKVSGEYREKKNRIAEIQSREALNSRIQGLGFPMGALIGSLAQALPDPYKAAGYMGGIISLGFAAGALISSRKLGSERKTFTGLEDWFRVHYVCPHCHTFLSQPIELLEKVKHCRACKKPLIP